MLLPKPPKEFPAASTKIRARHDSGERSLSSIYYAVIHCTEGSTAEAAAIWFRDPSSKGSANMVVDEYSQYMTLPDKVTPWAAPPLNHSGWHIELAGFAAWSNREWKKHIRTVQNAAYRTAIRCSWYNIEPVWRSPADLEKGHNGITSHNNVSLAFHQSDHTDPGPNFPYTYFMDCVHFYCKRMGVKV